MSVQTLQDRILHRIDTEVSPNCMHRLPSGECQKPEGLPCPIRANIDRMIEVVRPTSSDSIEPYAERLREIICGSCEMEDELGNCPLRDRIDCCLDALFVLVVNIVEEEINRNPSLPLDRH